MGCIWFLDSPFSTLLESVLMVCFINSFLLKLKKKVIMQKYALILKGAGCIWIYKLKSVSKSYYFSVNNGDRDKRKKSRKTIH